VFYFKTVLNRKEYFDRLAHLFSSAVDRQTSQGAAASSSSSSYFTGGRSRLSSFIHRVTVVCIWCFFCNMEPRYPRSVVLKPNWCLRLQTTCLQGGPNFIMPVIILCFWKTSWKLTDVINLRYTAFSGNLT